MTSPPAPLEEAFPGGHGERLSPSIVTGVTASIVRDPCHEQDLSQAVGPPEEKHQGPEGPAEAAGCPRLEGTREMTGK